MMFSNACFQHPSFQLGSGSGSNDRCLDLDEENVFRFETVHGEFTNGTHRICENVDGENVLPFNLNAETLQVPLSEFTNGILPLYLLLGCGVTRGLLKKKKKNKNKKVSSRLHTSTSSSCTDLIVYKEFDFQKELRGIRIHTIPAEALLCILRLENYISERKTRIFLESFQVQKLEAAIGLHVYESAAAFEVQQFHRDFEEAQDEISLGIFYYRTVGEEPLLLTDGIDNKYETSQLLAKPPSNLTNDDIHKVFLVFYVGVIALVKFISYTNKASILAVKSGLKIGAMSGSSPIKAALPEDTLPEDTRPEDTHPVAETESIEVILASRSIEVTPHWKEKNLHLHLIEREPWYSSLYRALSLNKSSLYRALVLNKVSRKRLSLKERLELGDMELESRIAAKKRKRIEENIAYLQRVHDAVDTSPKEKLPKREFKAFKQKQFRRRIGLRKQIKKLKKLL